jgi:hypothetical protein
MILTNPINVSEVGSLWQTYQEKTLIMRFLEYFIEKTDDVQARNILGGLWQELNFYVKEMEEIFRVEMQLMCKIVLDLTTNIE